MTYGKNVLINILVTTPFTRLFIGTLNLTFREKPINTLMQVYYWNFSEMNQKFLGQNAKQNLREYKNFRSIVFLTRKNQGDRKLLLFILNGEIEKLLLVSRTSLSVLKPWIMFRQKNMWWQVTRLPYLIPALTICMEALLNKIWAGKKNFTRTVSLTVTHCKLPSFDNKTLYCYDF